MSFLVGPFLQVVYLIKKKINFGKDCIEKLCKKLKECTMKIIDYEEKEMIPLTKEAKKSYKKQKKCPIREEKFCVDKDDENYTNREKVKDYCHYTGKLEELPIVSAN